LGAALRYLARDFLNVWGFARLLNDLGDPVSRFHSIDLGKARIGNQRNIRAAHYFERFGPGVVWNLRLAIVDATKTIVAGMMYSSPIGRY